MADITYTIVEHDGGWAYKLGDVFSEPFASHDEALAMAKRAAAEQRLPDTDETIEYQDEDGRWHQELAPGGDRPSADVVDEA